MIFMVAIFYIFSALITFTLGLVIMFLMGYEVRLVGVYALMVLPWNFVFYLVSWGLFQVVKMQRKFGKKLSFMMPSLLALAFWFLSLVTFYLLYTKFEWADFLIMGGPHALAIVVISFFPIRKEGEFEVRR